MNAATGAKEKLDALERVKLCFLPTPLQTVKVQQGSVLDKGVNIYFKRDDQTGLAMGGNKARKLEYMMADVLKKEAGSVITWGGMFSNWCRQTAAAAVVCGVKPVLVLLKKQGTGGVMEGNPLLDHLLGADIRVVEVEQNQKMMEFADLAHIIEPIAAEEEKKGYRPYVAPIGGSLTEGSMQQPFGALAYVDCFLEILRQAEEQGIAVDAVVLASGSAGTQAGLLAGARIFAPHVKVVGITVSEDRATMHRYIKNITEAVFAVLGVDMELDPAHILVFDEYIDAGYGVLTGQVAGVMQQIARLEGVLLDPVYTGKAMTGMIDLLEKKYFSDCRGVVFLHSGGLPTIFSYTGQLLEFLNASTR